MKLYNILSLCNASIIVAIVASFTFHHHSCADITITNKTNTLIEVRPTFHGHTCRTSTCPGDMYIKSGQTGTINLHNKKLKSIIVIEQKLPRVRRAMDNISLTDSLQNQNNHLIEYDGAFNIIS